MDRCWGGWYTPTGTGRWGRCTCGVDALIWYTDVNCVLGISGVITPAPLCSLLPQQPSLSSPAASPGTSQASASTPPTSPPHPPFPISPTPPLKLSPVSFSPRSMSCGLTRVEKLPGFEVIFLGQGRKMKLYCEQECFKHICNYYRLHTARHGAIRFGRRVNVLFRESVHISPHICAHLWPC
jgi:hypothetical protein